MPEPATPNPPVAAWKPCAGCDRETRRGHCCRNCWSATTDGYELHDAHNPGCDLTTHNRRAEKVMKP